MDKRTFNLRVDSAKLGLINLRVEDGLFMHTNMMDTYELFHKYGQHKVMHKL